MIVLDTHAWAWWTAVSAKLSATAKKHIEEASRIGVSAISAWEVAMLVARGRLRFDRDVLDWIDEALAQPRVVLLALSPEIAVRSTRLGHEAPADPADQILVATALAHRAPLVTRDRHLRRYPGLETIW